MVHIKLLQTLDVIKMETVTTDIFWISMHTGKLSKASDWQSLLSNIDQWAIITCLVSYLQHKTTRTPVK